MDSGTVYITDQRDVIHEFTSWLNNLNRLYDFELPQDRYGSRIFIRRDHVSSYEIED